MESSYIDLITAVKTLEKNALSCRHRLGGEPWPFLEGYLMALRHVLELVQGGQAHPQGGTK